MSVTLTCGNATEWQGASVDLVFTNPYAPLPECLRGKPAIISNFADRLELCERWVGASLTVISAWGRGQRNRVWVANTYPVSVMLSDLTEEEDIPGRGWFPLELPMRLLAAYGRPGITVWDGFAGRGTVGKACVALGMNFIGIDRNPERVALARSYLEC